MDATRGPILFRCDGTPEGGWEPLYRCLSLAAALQRRRRGTHFLSYLDPLSLATVINHVQDFLYGNFVTRDFPLVGGFPSLFNALSS